MTGITFVTRDYVNAHGKEPRGYGWWCFSQYPEAMSDPTLNWFSFTGTYTEAKKQARKHFRENNDYTVYVMP